MFICKGIEGQKLVQDTHGGARRTNIPIKIREADLGVSLLYKHPVKHIHILYVLYRVPWTVQMLPYHLRRPMIKCNECTRL